MNSLLGNLWKRVVETAQWVNYLLCKCEPWVWIPSVCNSWVWQSWACLQLQWEGRQPGQWKQHAPASVRGPVSKRKWSNRRRHPVVTPVSTHTNQVSEEKEGLYSWAWLPFPVRWSEVLYTFRGKTQGNFFLRRPIFISIAYTSAYTLYIICSDLSLLSFLLDKIIGDLLMSWRCSKMCGDVWRGSRVLIYTVPFKFHQLHLKVLTSVYI